MRFIQSIYFIFSLFFIHLQAALPQIHVIGDSHSLEFSKIPECMVHWIGPITMHRIGRDGLNALNLKQFNVQESQAVVFAFGEIDVRCHIGKQRDQKGRPLEEIIHHLAINYIHTILKNRQQYKQLTCIVYSVTPPTNQGYNPQFPYYGSLQDRIHLSSLLNAKLALLCQLTGILFLDVYEDYADQNGTLLSHLSDGSVHIHPLYFHPIQRKLNQIFETNNLNP
jgi:hypothetical protein